MKSGRIGWWSKLSGPLKRRLDELIDARALSGRAIYDQLNLARYTGYGTYRRYYTLRRKERAARKRRGTTKSGLTTESTENAEKKPKTNSSAGSASSVVKSGSAVAPGADLASKVNNIIVLAVDKAYSALLADQVGKLQLSRLLSELQDIKEFFDIDLAAEQRAAEKHAVWKKKEQRRQERALEKLSKGTRGLTAKLKAKIKAEVLGL